MKKILSLLMLLVAIVTGASADTEWVMKDWSTGHTGLTYWASGASADISSTSTDKNVPAWADESTYDTYTGTGGASNFQLDSKTSTWKSSNPNRVWSFDVNANDVIKVYFMGGGSGNRSMYVSYNASTTNRDTETAFGSATADGYTPTILSATATTAGTVYLWSDNNVRVYAIKVKSGATTAPTITTDLPATADVTVGVAEEFSIVANGATSYQWYKDWVAIEGATSATYSYTAAAAGTVFLQCKAINSIGETSSATCEVTATAPANPPVITTNLEAAYNVIKGQTQELSIVAEDASSYQWYLDGVAVEDAITDTYTFKAGSTIGATNEVYCAATNAAGTTNSATATITTVGRADCEVTNIKFSNGAYGAINNATYGDGTIAVPYIAGTSAPTVEEASINISDGATYVLSGNTLTVTAEDETTSKEYTINAVEITPLTVSADVAETSFTEVPSWVFNLYGWDKDKGVKFAKKVDEASNMRIAKGNTRQYWFIGAAKSITLTSGTGGERNIKVYRNGVQLSEPTKTAAKGSDITIALDETAPCMIMIESNQTGGDGGFSAYAIEAAAATIEVTLGANGYSTYCGDENFTVTSGATAYTATLDGTTVTLNEVAANTVIGKGTGIVLVGTEGETAVLTPTTEAAASMELGNALVGVNAETTDVNADAYVLASNGTKTAFVKAGSYANKTALLNKAYIVYAGMQEGSLDIQFEGEATAINNVNANDNADSAAPVKVIKNGKLFIGNYNVAGQLVK